MQLRIVKQSPDGTRIARIYRNYKWDEYHVTRTFCGMLAGPVIRTPSLIEANDAAQRFIKPKRDVLP